MIVLELFLVVGNVVGFFLMKMLLYRLFPPLMEPPLTLSRLRTAPSAWTCTPPPSINGTSRVTARVSLPPFQSNVSGEHCGTFIKRGVQEQVRQRDSAREMSRRWRGQTETCPGTVDVYR